MSVFDLLYQDREVIMFPIFGAVLLATKSFSLCLFRTLPSLLAFMMFQWLVFGFPIQKRFFFCFSPGLHFIVLLAVNRLKWRRLPCLGPCHVCSKNRLSKLFCEDGKRPCGGGDDHVEVEMIMWGWRWSCGGGDDHVEVEMMIMWRWRWWSCGGGDDHVGWRWLCGCWYYGHLDLIYNSGPYIRHVVFLQ